MILRATVSSLVVLFMATPAAAASAPSPAVLQKIAPWVLQKTEAGQAAEFLLVLGDQADLTPAAVLKTKAEKGRFVYETLFKQAQATQAPLLADLQARGVEHRSYYIVNMIWVKGDRALALDLAARGDVAKIEANPEVHNVLPVEEAAGAEIFAAPDSPTAAEPGISFVHAPGVWSLGFNGGGAVVAGSDTGQRWTHNALKSHYRGWNGIVASHDFNWHDSVHPPATGGTCSANHLEPCDDQGHGSHTIGTAIGDDGGTNQVGMAPGAKWIGCRNMDQGTGTPARYIECFEFFLAPYPVSGTPAQGNPLLAPDVSVNSWGCPLPPDPQAECAAADIEPLRQAVAAQRAAGILTEASAGNSGSACSTVQDPPAMHDESFTVGALNTGTDNAANFSSRGPVALDASNRTKPDIAAPGTSTRSSTRTSDSSFGSMSGTSMAGPHVAGAVALLLSAAPGLSGDVDAIERCLTASAVRLSSAACSSTAGVYPNNTFGHGRLDILAAVQLLLSNVSIGVTGSTTIGSASPCVGGTATVTDTGGGVNGHQWGYRTITGGPITDLPGQTGASYTLNCTQFPSIGIYRLVERTTPQCGVSLVSNEIVVTVDSTPVELQTFGID